METVVRLDQAVDKDLLLEVVPQLQVQAVARLMLVMVDLLQDLEVVQARQVVETHLLQARAVVRLMLETAVVHLDLEVDQAKLVAEMLQLQDKAVVKLMLAMVVLQALAAVQAKLVVEMHQHQDKAVVKPMLEMDKPQVQEVAQAKLVAEALLHQDKVAGRQVLAMAVVLLAQARAVAKHQVDRHLLVDLVQDKLQLVMEALLPVQAVDLVKHHLATVVVHQPVVKVAEQQTLEMVVVLQAQVQAVVKQVVVAVVQEMAVEIQMAANQAVTDTAVQPVHARDLTNCPLFPMEPA